MEAIIDAADFATLPIGCRESRQTLGWIRRKALTVKQIFTDTKVDLWRLNSGKWRWLLKDFDGHTVDYGTEDTKKEAHAVGMVRRNRHRAELKAAQNNLKKHA